MRWPCGSLMLTVPWGSRYERSIPGSRGAARRATRSVPSSCPVTPARRWERHPRSAPDCCRPSRPGRCRHRASTRACPRSQRDSCSASGWKSVARRCCSPAATETDHDDYGRRRRQTQTPDSLVHVGPPCRTAGSARGIAMRSWEFSRAPRSRTWPPKSEASCHSMVSPLVFSGLTTPSPVGQTCESRMTPQAPATEPIWARMPGVAEGGAHHRFQGRPSSQSAGSPCTCCECRTGVCPLKTSVQRRRSPN